MGAPAASQCRCEAGPYDWGIDDRELGWAGSTGFVTTVAGLGIAAGIGIAIVRFVGGTPAERGLEGAMGALALGAVVASPGWLALMGLADRPALLLPAATLLVPLSFLSFVLLPLLVPAVLLFVSYSRRSTGRSTRAIRAVPLTLFVWALLFAAIVALFVHEDPRSYVTATVSGSTSDVITAAEALISLALAAAATAGGWWMAAPEG